MGVPRATVRTQLFTVRRHSLGHADVLQILRRSDCKRWTSFHTGDWWTKGRRKERYKRAKGKACPPCDEANPSAHELLGSNVFRVLDIYPAVTRDQNRYSLANGSSDVGVVHGFVVDVAWRLVAPGCQRTELRSQAILVFACWANVTS